MGVLATFIIGAVAGGATWELYKRRVAFQPAQLKNKALSLLRHKQPPVAADDVPPPKVEEVAISTEPKTVEIQLDQLEAIHGIGPVYARRLNEAGILTYADLAQTPAGRLIAIVAPQGKLTPDVAVWINRAKALMEQTH